MWVPTLAGVIALCSWARYVLYSTFTFVIMPFSIQVYKWVPGNCRRGVGNPVVDYHPGGDTPSHFTVLKDKYRHDWPADFTVTTLR